MAEQQTRKVGEMQEYPGSYAWPIMEVLCPLCEKWTGDYGEVDSQDKDGDWHHLCTKCAADIREEFFDDGSVEDSGNYQYEGSKTP